MSPSSATPATDWALTARWVFPVDRPPLERGTVTVRGEQIAAVEPHGRRTADLDLGNAALLPGFVNAHTHLDLTGLRGQCPPSPYFTDWLRGVIRHRRSQTPEQTDADIRAGLAECLPRGTTLLADVSAEGRSWGLLATAQTRAVVFRELLGLTEDRARQAGREGLRWLVPHQASPTCRPGLGPHAPYSFRYQHLPALGGLRIPLTIHLAESAAEMELLGRHSGSFVPFLAGLGVWDPTGLAWSANHVLQLTAGETPVVYAHGNYLPADAPVPPNGTIVYCPRTHAAFGHKPHPFRDFLARGVRVALGTDSLASNPDLDVLAEARFLQRQYPELPGDVLLRMLTLSGAEALGWADETGSLTPGKSADLVVLPLPDAEPADPHPLVFASALAVRAVLWRGRWVHGRP